MRLTIVPVDNLVIVDNITHSPIDISNCSIPKNVHALQWYESRGWIEFKDNDDPFIPKLANQDIVELPEWAAACIAKWEEWIPPVIEQEIIQEPFLPENAPLLKE